MKLDRRRRALTKTITYSYKCRQTANYRKAGTSILSTSRNHPQSCKTRRTVAWSLKGRNARPKAESGVRFRGEGSGQRAPSTPAGWSGEWCKLPVSPDRKHILEHSERRKCVRMQKISCYQGVFSPELIWTHVASTSPLTTSLQKSYVELMQFTVILNTIIENIK